MSKASSSNASPLNTGKMPNLTVEIPPISISSELSLSAAPFIPPAPIRIMTDEQSDLFDLGIDIDSEIVYGGTPPPRCMSDNMVMARHVRSEKSRHLKNFELCYLNSRMNSNHSTFPDGYQPISSMSESRITRMFNLPRETSMTIIFMKQLIRANIDKIILPVPSCVLYPIVVPPVKPYKPVLLPIPRPYHKGVGWITMDEIRSRHRKQDGSLGEEGIDFRVQRSGTPPRRPDNHYMSWEIRN